MTEQPTTAAGRHHDWPCALTIPHDGPCVPAHQQDGSALRAVEEIIMSEPPWPRSGAIRRRVIMEKIRAALPPSAPTALHDALITVYRRAADARAWVEHVHLGADCPMIALDAALNDVLRLDPDLRGETKIPASYGAPPSAPPSLDAAALREVGTRDPWVMAGDHPESHCGRCGHANVWSWHAPSPLWNAVMRDPKTGADAYDVVCPPCFSELASLKGLGGKPLDGLPRWSWKFAPDISDEEIAALWADRDGRVWDPETWLWKDAAALPPSTPPEKGTGGAE